MADTKVKTLLDMAFDNVGSQASPWGAAGEPAERAGESRPVGGYVAR
ncbi:hypothetical protein AB0K16_09815 [Nonomuraea jabiensis]